MFFLLDPPVAHGPRGHGQLVLEVLDHAGLHLLLLVVAVPRLGRPPLPAHRLNNLEVVIVLIEFAEEFNITNPGLKRTIGWLI